LKLLLLTSDEQYDLSGQMGRTSKKSLITEVYRKPRTIANIPRSN
jgi:hypothetical protein